MDQFDYVARARALMAKTTRKAALVIVPLAAAASAAQSRRGVFTNFERYLFLQRHRQQRRRLQRWFVADQFGPGERHLWRQSLYDEPGLFLLQQRWLFNAVGERGSIGRRNFNRNGDLAGLRFFHHVGLGLGNTQRLDARV